MRKITAFLLFVFIFIPGINAYAIADSAKSACVINSLTGDVVFSKNMNERLPMASTTKIMTAILAIELCDMDEVITVSRNAALQEGSSAYLREGSQLYMRDVLYGLMLNSGNDAAVAIAEHICGDEDSFVELMNEKAAEMGLRDTHFVTPNGLPDEEHFTTARELAQIAAFAMLFPEFREIVSTRTMQLNPLNSEETLYFSNHNKMLSLYEGANGVKTGFTKDAGRCLVSSAERDNMEFIAVTLNDANDWNDHIQMLDYAFSEHYPKKVIKAGTNIKTASIDGKSYSMVAESDFIIPFKEHDKVKVELVAHIADNLASPINAGEKVGIIEVRCNDRSIGEVNIISEDDIYGVSDIRFKNSFFNSFINIIKVIL